MRSPALLVAVSAFLSGCAGTALDGSQQPERFTDPSLGALVGVVLDSELLPIAEAVAIVDDGEPTFSDQQGVFVAGNLTAGTHRVLVEKRGYATLHHEVTIVPGEETRRTFALERVASDVPYRFTMLQQGILNCGWAAVAHSAFCGGSSVEPVFGPFKAELRFLIPKDTKLTVAETSWTDRDQTMHDWYRDHTRGNATGQPRFLSDQIGKSPLRRVFEPGVKYPAFYSAPTVEHIAFPEGPFPFHVATFYDGRFQKEANDTLYPVCRNLILGYCSGVGVAIQFRYSQYVTVFVNGLPETARAFTALPDA